MVSEIAENVHHNFTCVIEIIEIIEMVLHIQQCTYISECRINTFLSLYSTKAVRITSLGPSPHGLGGSGTVDKRLCFEMMVWLTAYYEFFDKEVRVHDDRICIRYVTVVYIICFSVCVHVCMVCI